MNTHIDFKIAKLLKEKGFDEKCSHYYIDDFQNFKSDGILHKCGLPDNNKNENILQFVKRKNQPHLCNAPTISQVVMWLYEKHGIWISVDRVIIGSDEWEYCYSISYLPKEFENAKRRSTHLMTKESFKETPGSYVGAWDTPTEAYSEAIEYCLTKLI